MTDPSPPQFVQQAGQPAMQHIGFIGLGLMGTPMVRCLLAAGHPVSVWNRDPGKCAALAEAGATPAASPAALAGAVDHLFICVLDTGAVRDVVFGGDGAAAGMRAGQVLVDLSSIEPQATREMAAMLREHSGAGWVDAPVSGGVAGAARGTLAIMAGGSAADLDAVRPALGAIGSRVTHMGECGAGQLTKLCNQVIVAGSLAIVAEAVNLARRSGLDATRLTEALAGGSADSTALRVFGARMASGQSEPPLGPLALMLKDLDTAHIAARATHTALPMAATAAELLRMRAGHGHIGDDFSEFIRLYDEAPQPD